MQKRRLGNSNLQVSAIGDWFTRMGIVVVAIQLEPAS